MYTFSMDVDTTYEFFKRVQELGLKTEEERIHLLIDMYREGYPISVGQTNRDKDEYLRDLSKEFKVLDVTDYDKEDPEHIHAQWCWNSEDTVEYLIETKTNKVIAKRVNGVILNVEDYGD